jgi:hypothetical protein
MSADYWIDCPICGKERCVRVDCVYDVEVNELGLIDTSNIRAYCTACEKEFEHFKED